MEKVKETPICLIKFGSKKNMMKLINDGELRFSHPKGYDKAEKERGDSY